ncbi:MULTISPECIES: methyltransferase domain-containing protein [Salinivibrio]|uniref:Methyltransferase domain-containing protein n=3 Tax=Gammaproteobacteria TaxID=1236 RepID=A0ABY7LIV2_9GAMM|nr:MULTISPECIES: methyltransferase domain-containing protein [Salinivibrio]ODQ00979.1 SAM-dependent methyltransferase [Salinivibrio sp. DV]OOF21425.1 SAM-dependent methyltransferase [Salinivibrio sp. IB574]OOF28373.1 SAM-dependent methyltransferase [Salinivibrio sp. IB872]PCE69095.1 class I SAM-dependent methyltransferase [Salinivibrio sp. YCSC6]QCF36476.1 class I SAM-dependent methyltransferase [Salinivibrio sp. YCSC6]
MKPARIDYHYDYPYTWDQVAYGDWTRAQLQTRLDECLPNLFGYHLLKLGGLSCELVSQQCNIQHQVCVDKRNPMRNLTADHYALPFIEKSFDACLLAHQLDYSDDPHRLLREVDRVMIDDGYLILSGVNPTSVMGIKRVLRGRGQRLPWSGRMFSPLRIRDWLSVMNYEVTTATHFGLWPTKQPKARHAWVESSFAEFTPFVGCVYFIIARKRSYPLKPIKPRWKLKKAVAPLGGVVPNGG